MPRDGSNIYHRPAGTDGVPNYPIESSKYNAYVADVEQDLNLPRPIVAGGTGATLPADALQNLGGEFARQVITNYDSDQFQAGSFYSAAAATGAPVAGHAFVGICYTSDPAPALPTQNIIIEARDQNDTTTPGRVYIREKKVGVWGAWTVQVSSATELDLLYVNVSGDTMTGQLVLPLAAPTLPEQAANKAYVDAGTVAATKYVRYDAAQSLTAAQQAQARTNINAAGVYGFQVFATPGTSNFTTSANSTTATVYRYRMVGAGGGGGGSTSGSASSAAGGGGAGVYLEGTFTGVAPSTAISITVGGGGAGGTSVGANGVNGTNTVIGAPVSVTAGAGVGATTAAGAVTLGGIGGVGAGSPNVLVHAGARGRHGNSVSQTGGFGGSNPIGEGGEPGMVNIGMPGTLGWGYGSGGGGAWAGPANGGSGTNGLVIIEWVF